MREAEAEARRTAILKSACDALRGSGAPAQLLIDVCRGNVALAEAVLRCQQVAHTLAEFKKLCCGL